MNWPLAVIVFLPALVGVGVFLLVLAFEFGPPVGGWERHTCRTCGGLYNGQSCLGCQWKQETTVSEMREYADLMEEPDGVTANVIRMWADGLGASLESKRGYQ